MERRKSERLPFSSNASIVFRGQTYAGSIENVSEGGVEYLLTSSIKTSEDLTPEKLIKLNIQTPSGRNISLSCEVKWFLKMPQNGKKLTMGMKIINPPDEYRELIKELNSKNSN